MRRRDPPPSSYCQNDLCHSHGMAFFTPRIFFPFYFSQVLASTCAPSIVVQFSICVVCSQVSFFIIYIIYTHKDIYFCISLPISFQDGVALANIDRRFFAQLGRGGQISEFLYPQLLGKSAGVKPPSFFQTMFSVIGIFLIIIIFFFVIHVIVSFNCNISYQFLHIQKKIVDFQWYLCCVFESAICFLPFF